MSHSMDQGGSRMRKAGGTSTDCTDEDCIGGWCQSQKMFHCWLNRMFHCGLNQDGSMAVLRRSRSRQNEQVERRQALPLPVSFNLHLYRRASRLRFFPFVRVWLACRFESRSLFYYQLPPNLGSILRIIHSSYYQANITTILTIKAKGNVTRQGWGFRNEIV